MSSDSSSGSTGLVAMVYVIIFLSLSVGLLVSGNGATG